MRTLRVPANRSALIGMSGSTVKWNEAQGEEEEEEQGRLVAGGRGVCTELDRRIGLGIA